MKRFIYVILLAALLIGIIFSGCRRGPKADLTIALPDKFSGLDTLTSSASDAAADRIRTLIYNSLVKKNERFEYVGDLAESITVDSDNLTIRLKLRSNVLFHDGTSFDSADAKYTIESLLKTAEGPGGPSFKAGAFFDSGEGAARKPHLLSVGAPAPDLLVIKVERPALVNQTLSNLVTIPMIPEGTFEKQAQFPVGTGPFKFVSFDSVESTVDLAGFPNYWDGPSSISLLRVKTVSDSNALQSELRGGSVDLAPLPTNLTAEAIVQLGGDPALQVERFNGSNVQYIGFNLSQPPFNDINVRRAVAAAINRREIIEKLLLGQAESATSVLPVDSWAYSAGQSQEWDLAKAKSLLAQSSYKGEQVSLKFTSGSAAVKDYAQLVQDSLKQIGMNIALEPMDSNTLRTQLNQGQFTMSTGTWIGGNQDPIFLRDLYDSSYWPEKLVSGRNRARYSNPSVDSLLKAAINSVDRNRAASAYQEVQNIVSGDLPLIPLWYPSNIVIHNRRVQNVTINPSGDWSFVKDLRLSL